MKNFLLAWCSALLLTACATKETIPAVRVVPNASGIETGETNSHGPISIMSGMNMPPDTPSGISVSVQRIRPLHNKETRYFIPASGIVAVVSLERPAAYPDYSISADKILAWKRLVGGAGLTDQEIRQTLYREQLTEIPFANAGRCFHAKLRRRTFPWGKAILFLTSYVQGKTGGPVNNDMLVLTMQGFTNDGRYIVRGHLEIRHPRLPDSSWDKRTRGKAVFDIDEQDAAAEKWLDAQPDNAFAPTFQQYEAFLESLRIEPPGGN